MSCTKIGLKLSSRMQNANSYQGYILQLMITHPIFPSELTRSVSSLLSGISVGFFCWAFFSCFWTGRRADTAETGCSKSESWTFSPAPAEENDIWESGLEGLWKLALFFHTELAQVVCIGNAENSLNWAKRSYLRWLWPQLSAEFLLLSKTIVKWVWTHFMTFLAPIVVSRCSC